MKFENFKTLIMKNVLLVILLFVSILSYAQTAEVYNSRGLSKFDIKDYQGAIADFTKAIELIPNDDSAYYYRGLCKLMLNEKNSACLDFNKAKEFGNLEVDKMIKENCNKK